MSDEELDAWLDKEIALFMKTADEARMRRVFREEARILQSRDGGTLMRSYDVEPSTTTACAAMDTMVIAFGGLQQHIGGGRGGGVQPYEFVRSCRKAGARCALFVRDPTRCWYCRGLGEGGAGGAGGAGGVGGAGGATVGSSFTFEGMVEVLRAEVDSVRPRRLVTIGSSMGGYAAVRAGVLLGADLAVAFSPQVFIDLNERRQIGLRPVPIDDNFQWLQIVAACEGIGLPSLVDAVRSAPASCKTRLVVHVGGVDYNDVREAKLLHEAVEECTRHRLRRGTPAAGAGHGMTFDLSVHPGREHNLVVELRDQGQLHDMLCGWLSTDGMTTDGDHTSTSR